MVNSPLLIFLNKLTKTREPFGGKILGVLHACRERKRERERVRVPAKAMYYSRVLVNYYHLLFQVFITGVLFW